MQDDSQQTTKHKEKKKLSKFSIGLRVWLFGLFYAVLAAFLVAPTLGEMIPDQINANLARGILEGDGLFITLGLFILPIAFGSIAILLGARPWFGVILCLSCSLTTWQYTAMVLQPIMVRLRPDDLELAVGFEPAGGIFLAIIGSGLAYLALLPATMLRLFYQDLGQGIETEPV